MATRRKKDEWPDAVGNAAWTSYLEPAPGDLRIVQAFLNTDDLPRAREELVSPEALTDWLSRWRLVPEDTRLGDADLGVATEVRRGLRALILTGRGGKVDPKVMAELDRAVAGVMLRVRFSADGAIHFEPVTGGFEGALGRLLWIAVRARSEKRWSRLKFCPGDDCGRVFYDSSPNKTRKWCSMQRCGARAKGRRFRRRNPGHRARAKP